MSRAKELGAFLRQVRSQRGLSRSQVVAEVAKLGIKLSYDYLSKLETGERSFEKASLEIREGLRLVFGLSPDEWEDKTGLYVPIESSTSPTVAVEEIVDPLATRDIDLFDGVGAGSGFDEGSKVGTVAIPAHWAGDYRAFIVQGNSMEPDIPKGATIVVRMTKVAELGNTVLAYHPDHGLIIKKLVISNEQERQAVLASANPDYARILICETCEIRGVVRRVINIRDLA